MLSGFGRCHTGDEQEGSNEIVLCDGCDLGWHQKCCDPALAVIPRGSWYGGCCSPHTKRAKPKPKPATIKKKPHSKQVSDSDDDNDYKSGDSDDDKESDPDSDFEDKKQAATLRVQGAKPKGTKRKPAPKKPATKVEPVEDDEEALGLLDKLLTNNQIDKEVERASLLHSVPWLRIMLDEAHKIKARTTSTAKAVYGLRSHFKWCITGVHIPYTFLIG